ncbi:MAG: zinc ribbon domain-containing protein [Acidimicrobiia bacterium]|nr:zinc ribbon domain-containing protein [Acidimicrobiia bacterium]
MVAGVGQRVVNARRLREPFGLRDSDEDRHDALVAALAPRKSKPRKGRTYPLVGFLACGKCGGPLRSLTRENGGRSYACRKGPGMGGCGGIRIQANGLEEYMRDLICGLLNHPRQRQLSREYLV